MYNLLGIPFLKQKNAKHKVLYHFDVIAHIFILNSNDSEKQKAPQERSKEMHSHFLSLANNDLVLPTCDHRSLAVSIYDGQHSS